MYELAGESSSSSFWCGLRAYFVARDSVLSFFLCVWLQLIEALGVSLSESVALSN